MKKYITITTIMATIFLAACTGNKPKKTIDSPVPFSKEVPLINDTTFTIDGKSYCAHIINEPSNCNGFINSIITIYRDGIQILIYPIRTVTGNGGSYQIASIYLMGENLYIFEIADNSINSRNSLPHISMKTKNITSAFKTDTAIANYLQYVYPSPLYKGGAVFLEKKEWALMAASIPDSLKNDKYKCLMFNFGLNAKDLATNIKSKLNKIDVEYLQNSECFKQFPAPFMNKILFGNEVK
jgi:hypothetical protein